MINNKKGISPLIATVLLIGFAISIAILVWFWYGNIIKEQAEKTGATSEGKLACASEVKYRVKNSCYKSAENPSDPDEYQVLLTIENKGSNIDDLRIRIEGSLNTETISLGILIAETETKQTSAQYNNSKIGTINKIVIQPIIFRQNTPVVCTEKEQELSVKSCS